MTRLSELERLRHQVDVLQETLRAIQAGEIDVLLGATEHAPFYAAESADRPYRVMIEQMRDGALCIAEDQETVLYCNRAFAAMCKRGLGQIAGRAVTSFLSARGVQDWRALVAATPSRRDVELVQGDGERLLVSISLADFVHDGRPRLIATIVDLTDRRDAERLREARAELELLNRRKDEFIAVLGHELRNPLAPLRHAAELLEDDDPCVCRKAREIISRQVSHMSRLVDDLLDAGRITRGTLMVELRQLALGEVVDAAVESVQRLIRRRGHTLEVEIVDPALRVLGDPVRLTQVFTNLLANAAKYTEDSGHIELVARSSSGMAEITITDNGQGISGDLLPHIFEPFVQGPEISDRGGGGLGVGLTLVRRIVELHHGAVDASSPGVGQGAQFRVRLPLAASARVQSESVAAAVRASASMVHRITVVDDNEDAVEMLQLLLERRGFQVRTFIDGESAVAALDETDPDVMIVDIGLPGIDGFEVARRVRERKGPRVHLVALTGFGQDSDRHKAIDAGFDEHVVKPIAPEALDRLLDSAKQRGSA